jgi:hypothetical protein
MALDLGARTENAEEFGGKFVSLAIVESDRECGLVLAQPNLGGRGRGRMVCFERHRELPHIAMQPAAPGGRIGQNEKG